MKEVTYGWYPSVHDIYRPKWRPSTQHLQCLYNFRNFRGEMVTPQPELFVRGISSTASPSPLSPTPQELIRRTRSAPLLRPALEPKIHIPTPTECWSRAATETQWGVVGDHSPLPPHPPPPPSEVSWPGPHGSQQTLLQIQKDPQETTQQKLLQKQHDYQQKDKNVTQTILASQNSQDSEKFSQDSSSTCSEADSDLMWPVAHKHVPLRPKSAFPGQFQHHSYQSKSVEQKKRPSSSHTKPANQVRWDAVTPTPPSGNKTFSSKQPIRIQSAVVRHEKARLPSRPVTAGARQNLAQEKINKLPPESPAVESSPTKPETTEVSEPERPPTRPAVPVPFVHDVGDTVCESEEGKKLSKSSTFDEDDYEKIVDKYGWRAQIPGDPYRLKKPKIKRESYVVRCKEPEVLPDPPTVHIETKEPFFYNTIPRRPLSFTVDRTWMSEILTAKRLELQKRDGGIKYNCKNFAFVY